MIYSIMFEKIERDSSDMSHYFQVIPMASMAMWAMW